MASSGDIDGDEFSNNLFSDLAPLIALFGEEVTTQFLSLSLGWADNFLLAIGPVGIIATVISAIRIGGGRGLKSLIGRVREVQAVADQELLSSTSTNVCELWDGQQVVRVIGEAKGMAISVISRDGKIYSLLSAFDQDFICIDDGGDEKGTNKMEQPSLRDIFEEELKQNNLSVHLNLPPNLTLNTRFKPASGELWLLACLGIILQTMALVYPGIATYHLKWDKKEVPVAAYGYPCFAAGTISLAIGMMLCGHIISGAAQEIDFKLSEKANQEGMRLLYVQKALSMGDYKLPSCAIFLAARDKTLRTSRTGYLKHGRARNRAIVSTFLAISGYVVQFVGLRALHWSSTIVQLSVTLMMTAIRAWARRSLASEPQTSNLCLEGYEKAWLTLLVRFEGEETPVEESICRHFLRNTQEFISKLCVKLGYDRKLHFAKFVDGKVHFDENQFLWELISDHSQESGSAIDCLRDSQSRASLGKYVRDRTGFVSNQLLQRIQGPLKTSFEIRTGTPADVAALNDHSSPNSVRTYIQINSQLCKTTMTDEDAESLKASAVLCEIIEDVMGFLSATDELDWKRDIKNYFKSNNFNKKEPGQLHYIRWGFDVREGRVSQYDVKPTTRSHFQMTLQRRPHTYSSHSWHLSPEDRDRLQAAISLSLYTDAVRLMYATSETKTTTPMAQRRVKPFTRIVGHAKRLQDTPHMSQMQEWLEIPIKHSTLSEMRLEGSGVSLSQKAALTTMNKLGRPAWLTERKFRPLRKLAEQLIQGMKQGVEVSYLGTFLSSFADPLEGAAEDAHYELFVKQSSDVSSAFQYAQEVFSLFILATASEVALVKGETHRKNRKDGSGKVLLENSLFKSVAKIVDKKKLVRNMDEAYTLIIPAFAKHNLLPTMSNPQSAAYQRDPVIRRDLMSDEFSSTARH